MMIQMSGGEAQMQTMQMEGKSDFLPFSFLLSSPVRCQKSVWKTSVWKSLLLISELAATIVENISVLLIYF